jgi:hypothetical protein
VGGKIIIAEEKRFCISGFHFLDDVLGAAETIFAAEYLGDRTETAIKGAAP